MREIMENIWMIDKRHDLIYSSMDEEMCGKGWYITKSYPKPVYEKGSELFATKDEALRALRDGEIQFK